VFGWIHLAGFCNQGGGDGFFDWAPSWRELSVSAEILKKRKREVIEGSTTYGEVVGHIKEL